MFYPRISIICALSKKRVIGKGDRIPWHITADLIRFKEKTLHHTVIMGRATFDSLLSYYKKSGRALPERNTIIVTRDTTYNPHVKSCFIVDSIEKAFQKAREIEKEEVFISGGEQIFKQTIGVAQKLYLTLVQGEYEGDKFFPDYSDFHTVLAQEDREENGLRFTFLDLTR